MTADQGYPSLGKSTLHLLGAQVSRNLAPILLIFLLARFTDQETVGSYSLALAIATPIFVVAQLGLRTVSLTLSPDAGFSNYMKVQASSLLLALLVLAATGWLSTPGLFVLILIVGLLKCADAFADFLSGPLQRRGRSLTVFTASVIYAVAAATAAAIALMLTKNLEITVLLVALVSLIATAIFLYIPALRSATVERRTNTGTHRSRILSAGIPLGLTSGLLALTSTTPQYVITSSLGEASTARFAIILYVYALADIAVGTVAQAWIPSAQDKLLNSPGSRSIHLAVRAALKWSFALVPTVTIGLIAAAALFPLIFGESYSLSFAEAVPLGLAILILPLTHFTATAVAIENYYKHTLVIAITSSVVAIISCLLLIPTLGLTGAFLALAASVLTRAVVAIGILLLSTKGRIV